MLITNEKVEYFICFFSSKISFFNSLNICWLKKVYMISFISEGFDAVQIFSLRRFKSHFKKDLQKFTYMLIYIQSKKNAYPLLPLLFKNIFVYLSIFAGGINFSLS